MAKKFGYLFCLVTPSTQTRRSGSSDSTTDQIRLRPDRAKTTNNLFCEVVQIWKVPNHAFNMLQKCKNNDVLSTLIHCLFVASVSESFAKGCNVCYFDTIRKGYSTMKPSTHCRAKIYYFNQDFLRCCRDPLLVPGIRENYHWVPIIREIRSLPGS